MDNSFKNLENVLTGFDKMSSTLSDINAQMSTLNDTCKSLVSTLDGMNQIDFSGILSDFGSLFDIASGLAFVGEDLKGISDALTAFGAILSAINIPLMAFVTGVGLAVVGVAEWADSQNDAGRALKLFSEQQEKEKEAIDKVTESLYKNAEAARESVNAVKSDYSLTLGQIDQLVSLTGKDGYVGNVEQAKYLIDEINSVLPNSVELVNNNKVVWKDLNREVTNNIDKIKESIEMLKQKAIVEAYEKEYVEAVKKENELIIAKIQTQNELNDVTARHNELTAKGSELTYEELGEKAELALKIELSMKKSYKIK